MDEASLDTARPRAKYIHEDQGRTHRIHVTVSYDLKMIHVGNYPKIVVEIIQHIHSRRGVYENQKSYMYQYCISNVFREILAAGLHECRAVLRLGHDHHAR